MSLRTTDLCDAHGDARVLDLQLSDFGGRIMFHGPVSTVRALEDNSRVREAVAEPGDGRVLVIDGGGSTRRAMLGDLLAAKAVQNGWAGVVVHGVIRDSEAIAALDLLENRPHHPQLKRQAPELRRSAGGRVGRWR